jgi:hypothetical protein
VGYRPEQIFGAGRRRPTATSRLWVCLVLALAGCQGRPDSEFPNLGRTEANSEPPAGIYRPIPAGDTDEIAERGALLFAMERALRLGYEKGAFAVGFAEGDTILPLVDVDPGGRSAQVVFVRWAAADKEKGGRLRPEQAERWLLVSMRLAPDQIIDRELLTGKVIVGSDDYHRVRALLVAAEALRQQTPGEVYHLYTVAEVMPTGKKKRPTKLATRVYALSADGDGPDLEVLVDAPKRKRDPEVLSVETIHEAGAAEASPIRVALPQPAPATVVRAMLEGPEAGDVPVQGSGGALYAVSASDGRITRPQP